MQGFKERLEVSLLHRADLCVMITVVSRADV